MLSVSWAQFDLHTTVYSTAGPADPRSVPYRSLYPLHTDGVGLSQLHILPRARQVGGGAGVCWLHAQGCHHHGQLASLLSSRTCH